MTQVEHEKGSGSRRCNGVRWKMGGTSWIISNDLQRCRMGHCDWIVDDSYCAELPSDLERHCYLGCSPHAARQERRRRPNPPKLQPPAVPPAPSRPVEIARRPRLPAHLQPAAAGVRRLPGR
jgi:hypothetical protein